MAARIFARSGIFVNAISPVIVQAKPGRFQEMLQSIRPLALTNILDLGPGGFLKPWTFGALTAARSMPSFGMHASVFDGWTLGLIAEDENVHAIYEDRPLRLLQFPSVPLDGSYELQVGGKPFFFTSTEWTRRLLGADLANAQGFTGAGVTACVVDTGGTRAEPSTIRMIRQTAIPGNHVDMIGHGQWCAAALGGTRVQDHTFSAELRRGVYCEGMAPACNLMQIKALDYVVGMGMTSQLLAGLEMALKAKADVLSLSWGGAPGSTTPEGDPFLTAMRVLDQAGVLVAAAAGNSGPGTGTIDSPGALPQPVTVGAYNAVGNPANPMFGAAGAVSGFSSRGPTPWGDTKPDTIAPGAIIDAPITGQLAVAYTHRAHAFQSIAGTSMATPIVAGLLTCMRQAHQRLLGKTLTNAEVKAMLAALGEPKNNASGWGPLTWPLYLRWLSTQYSIEVG